jgi:outer membrane protein OmpA-like peptidoglycan-associated protein
MPKSTIFIFLILILSANILYAESIKQRTYNYRYDDGAEGMPDQTYLICNDCQDDKPSVVPNLVAHASIATQTPMIEPAAYNIANSNQVDTVKPLVQSKPFFEKVHFNFDSSMLLPEAISILDRIDTKRSLRLAGYTCTIGTDKYNLGLSQKRADAVSRYLKKRGISILSSIGNGKSSMYPDKSLNRRVDIFENKENNGS